MKKINTAFREHLSYGQYLKYILPSIVSMVFLSFYTTIDGFFVSRFVNSDALAAINIVIPLTCVFFGISIMLSTGAGAIIGIRQGNKQFEEADQFFSFVTSALVVIIISLTLIECIFLEPILKLCGATDILMPYALPYGKCLVAMTPAMMLKLYFEYFARIDGHPKVSMVMSVCGLVLNLILDFVFVVPLEMGILGAGIATAISMYISAFIGIFHFISGRSTLRFVKPKREFKKLFFAFYNGSSEMMTELSTGITTLLFNLLLLDYAGESGVAAMAIITYFYYFFVALFLGVTVAGQPVISYNIGAKALEKLKEIVKQSLVTISAFAVVIFAISFFFTKPLIMIFTRDPAVIGIATYGFKLFSFTFLLRGFSIFISGYFTAIGNGGFSALVSFCRSLVFLVIFLETLPHFIGVTGIWLAQPLAELITVVIAVPLFSKFNKHKKAPQI